MQIKWIGQSGYIISDGKTEICIDPYLSDVVNKVAGRERMVESPVQPQDLQSDIVICTHRHLDHLDVDAIPGMNLEKMVFYAPGDCREKLDEAGVKNYVQFDEGTKAAIGEFELEAVFADHTVPAIGVIVRYNGKSLYFSGDTYYNKKLEKISGINYMFVCINGRLGNMNVDEAVRLTAVISPDVGIPNHYGMFESNTEDPVKYTDHVKNGFIMEFNKNYSLDEIA